MFTGPSDTGIVSTSSRLAATACTRATACVTITSNASSTASTSVSRMSISATIDAFEPPSGSRGSAIRVSRTSRSPRIRSAFGPSPVPVSASRKVWKASRIGDAAGCSRGAAAAACWAANAAATAGAPKAWFVSHVLCGSSRSSWGSIPWPEPSVSVGIWFRLSPSGRPA